MFCNYIPFLRTFAQKMHLTIFAWKQNEKRREIEQVFKGFQNLNYVFVHPSYKFL